jgi:hypothetical protein
MAENHHPAGGTSRRAFLTGAGAAAGAVGWAGLAHASEQPLAMPGGEADLRMVYQINRDDPDYYGHILFSMGEMLRQTSNRAGLAAVCFGPGLNLLIGERPETVSPEARDRVASLMTYGVTFQACRQTMAAMELSDGDLMDGVEPVPAGVLSMARMQQEGYAYVAW